MSHKTAATAAHTVGIDTGKNTLHLIGLDDKGAIVLREKIARGRIRLWGIHAPAKYMARAKTPHPSNINRITPDRHRLGHETGQNRVKPVIRSRHGHISHGYMKFTRKDVIGSGACPADFISISSDVRASQAR